MSFLTKTRDWLLGPPNPRYHGTRTSKGQAGRKVYTGRAAAPVGSYRSDRVARGGGALEGARANVSRRTVNNAYDSRTGRRHNPVQHAAAQYHPWWGSR